jgi:hypothetical protein
VLRLRSIIEKIFPGQKAVGSEARSVASACEVGRVRALVDRGQLHEAIAAANRGLARSPPDAVAFELLLVAAEAHRRLRETAAAIEALAKAVTLRPDDENALEVLCNLTATAEHGDADGYRARLLAMQASRLPARLNDGLRGLWDAARARPLESLELEWAWELADKTRWDRAEWRVAATWGHDASRYLRRWWDSRPDQVAQIDEFLDEPDFTEIAAVVSRGQACLLVGAHVGPISPGLNLLRSRFGLKTLGTAGRDQPKTRTMLPVAANYFAVTRALVNEVKRGSVIALMADAPLAHEVLVTEFLGREVHLPAIVPRLVQAYRLPSFWCCPQWRGERAFLEIERLPDSRTGEAPPRWADRWFDAYLTKVERVMRGTPENLGLYSGIWANVDQTVVQARRTQSPRSRQWKRPATLTTGSVSGADADAAAYVEAHVIPLLRNPLNLVRQTDAAARAHSLSGSVAAALRLDREPLEALLRDILEANLPGSMSDLLARIQEIECLPGYPGMENFDAERFCGFLSDAASRSRKAQDKGVPPTPIFAYPKSASAFVAEVMADAVDVPVGIATFQHWMGVKPWAAFVARQPFVVQEHCAPTDENIDLLHDAGCRKLVLHLRDPRQVVVSSAHHVTRADAPERLKGEYADLTFEAVLDRMIDQFVPTQRFWFEQWRGRTAARDIDVLFTTFERMSIDRAGFFYEIFEFFKVPEALYDRLPRSLWRVLEVTRPGNLHFRSGLRDEWREVLSPRQIRRIAEKTGGAFSGIYDI